MLTIIYSIKKMIKFFSIIPLILPENIIFCFKKNKTNPGVLFPELVCF